MPRSATNYRKTRRNQIVRRIISILAAFILLSGLSAISIGQIRYTPRHHHGHTRNINHRQNRQQRRIANGIRHHKLTAHETGRLERREARTNRMERRFRKSGHGLSHTERRRLNHRLNGTSRAIYRKKHNRRKAH